MPSGPCTCLSETLPVKRSPDQCKSACRPGSRLTLRGLGDAPRAANSASRRSRSGRRCRSPSAACRRQDRPTSACNCNFSGWPFAQRRPGSMRIAGVLLHRVRKTANGLFSVLAVGGDDRVAGHQAGVLRRQIHESPRRPPPARRDSPARSNGCGSLRTLVVNQLAVALDHHRLDVPGRGKRQFQRHAVPRRILDAGEGDNAVARLRCPPCRAGESFTTPAITTGLSA